jgi:hypothetical protein
MPHPEQWGIFTLKLNSLVNDVEKYTPSLAQIQSEKIRQILL